MRGVAERSGKARVARRVSRYSSEVVLALRGLVRARRYLGTRGDLAELWVIGYEDLGASLILSPETAPIFTSYHPP